MNRDGGCFFCSYKVGRDEDQKQGEGPAAHDVSERAYEEQPARVAGLHEGWDQAGSLEGDAKVVGQDLHYASQTAGFKL